MRTVVYTVTVPLDPKYCDRVGEAQAILELANRLRDAVYYHGALHDNKEVIVLTTVQKERR